MKLQEFQVVFPGTVFKKITSFLEILRMQSYLQSKDQFRGNTGPDSGRNTESPETGLRASRRAFRTERSHKDQGKGTLDG